MSQAITLEPTQWLVYYLGDSLVTLACVNTSGTTSAITDTSEIGATSYTVYDAAYNVVYEGICATTDTSLSFALSELGSTGANAGVAGYYTVVTANGYTGYFSVCPTTRAASRLYVAPTTPPGSGSFNAWLGTAPDRSLYEYWGVPYATMASNYTHDPYFQGVQDSARPRQLWITTSAQSEPVYTVVGSSSVGQDPATITTIYFTSVTGLLNAGIQCPTTTSPVVLYLQDLSSSTLSATCTYVSGGEGGTLVSADRCVQAQNGGQSQNGNDWIYELQSNGIDNGLATGAFWELPTNEPENGGWEQPADGDVPLALYWAGCASAILSVDSTATFGGWDSGGVPADWPYSNIAAFASQLSALDAAPWGAFTVHMENSHQSQPNVIALQQMYGGWVSEFVSAGLQASGGPNFPVWLTETGVNSNSYNVLQPRRDAKWTVVHRLVAETFGWPKEHTYDYPGGPGGTSTGLSFLIIDNNTSDYYGCVRARGTALHAISEALAGTYCTPSNCPTLTPVGVVDPNGYATLYYSHYKGGLYGDRVWIIPNGLQPGTLTFRADAAPSASYCPDGVSQCWDILGTPWPVTSNPDGSYTITYDDFPRCLFFPPNFGNFEVVDTDQYLVSRLARAKNLCSLDGVTIVNENGTSATGVLNSGEFTANGSGLSNAVAPYSDAGGGPYTLTVSDFGTQPVSGYLIMSQGPAWQSAGCGLTSITVEAEVDGSYIEVDSWTDETAVSYPIWSAAPPFDHDQCGRTTFWDGTWTVARSFPPVDATSVKFTIGVSYGGQPDEAASTSDTGSGEPENGLQDLYLSQLMVFGQATSLSPALLVKFGGC